MTLHPTFQTIFDTHFPKLGATKTVTPNSYRDWHLNGFEYGYWTAMHKDFDASYEGLEDGWVGSHPTLSARSPDELFAEIDAWHDEQAA